MTNANACNRKCDALCATSTPSDDADADAGDDVPGGAAVAGLSQLAPSVSDCSTRPEGLWKVQAVWHWPRWAAE